MRVMGLDVASYVIGYAVLDGIEARQLVDAGRLVATDSLRSFQELAQRRRMHEWQSAWLEREELRAYRRIIVLLADVSALIAEHLPDRIVVEVPSGKIGTGALCGARGSLTTYGAAAGAIWARCMECRPGTAVPVTERMWTRTRGGKRAGQMLIQGLYPGRYAPGDDPGADVSDAILLARWWIEQEVGVAASSERQRREEHQSCAGEELRLLSAHTADRGGRYGSCPTRPGRAGDSDVSVATVSFAPCARRTGGAPRNQAQR